MSYDQSNTPQGSPYPGNQQAPYNQFQNNQQAAQYNQFQGNQQAAQYNQFQYNQFQNNQQAAQYNQFQYNQQNVQYSQFQNNQQAAQYNQFQYNQFQNNQQAAQYNQFLGNQQNAQYNQFQNNQHYGGAAYIPEMHLSEDIYKKDAKVKKKSKLPVIFASFAIVAVMGFAAYQIGSRLKDKTSGDDTKGKSTTEAVNHKETTEATTEKDTEATTEAVTAADGTKTIMIYMVGSNLESESQAGYNDMNEMFDADFDEDYTNVLIYTGGCKDWKNSDIPDEGNACFIIEDSDITKLYDDEQKNMGKASTLSDFLNYGYTNYPAQEYDVILWNHGGGAFYGFGMDEVSDDSLTLVELSEAFADTPFKDDNKLSFIGFDACLMANAETAKVLSPYATYMVASQEPEPGLGWNYAFMDNLDNDFGETLCEDIVDAYMDGCEEEFSDNLFSYTDVTLSVLDLTKISDVETSIDNLFTLCDSSMDDAGYEKNFRIRSEVKEVATIISGDSSYDVVDLYDLADCYTSLYPSEAEALKEALDSFIVYNYTNVTDENGVSIYFPYNAKKYASTYVGMYSAFDFSPAYTKFISDFSQMLTGGYTSAASWDIEDLNPYMADGYRFSMDLSDGEANDIIDSYFVITRADSNTDGNVDFVAMSGDTDLSGNTVTANFDGNIIYIQNDKTKEYYEAMYTVKEKTDEYTRYLISCVLYNDSIQEEDAMYTYLVLEVTPDNPSGEILGAYPIDYLVDTIDNGGTTYIFASKYSVDFDDYKYIAFGEYSHEYTGTENLNYFDESEWSDLILNYVSFPISDGFSTVRQNMFEDIPYYGMFVIKDSAGEYHSSNLVQIQ